jgi:hypothetical protein
MAVSVAAPASATTARAGTQRQAAQESRSAAPSAVPAFSQDLEFKIGCASWKGELAWAERHEDDPAEIDVNGVLKSPCSDGHAQLHIHYDTIDNPKDIQIKAAGPESIYNTPWKTEDWLNNYKDIYVWICSWRGTNGHETHYHCSHKKGPGA